MPQDLPLGNGNLQINFDSAYRIVDLYCPYVGQDNHGVGHPFRVGLWLDGEFSWTESPEWVRELAYLPATLVTQVRLSHRRLDIALEFHEAIDCDRNIFIRRLSIANHAREEQRLKLLLHHDFYLSATDVGDTAYFDPTSGGLIHYKGKVWVLSNVQRDGCVRFDALPRGRKAGADARALGATPKTAS
jgi:glucoamylase